MKKLRLASRIHLLWLAFFSKKTPFAAKLLIVLGLLYGISPLDIVPDIIPLLGQLDDIGVLIFVISVFAKATKKIRERLRKTIHD